MARVDKSAFVTFAVKAIKSGRFNSTREIDKEFKVYYTIIIKKLKGIIKTR